jgi:hypothetical protein
LPYFQVLFELADLEIVYSIQQTDFPSELYPVMMFALQPKHRSTATVSSSSAAPSSAVAALSSTTFEGQQEERKANDILSSTIEFTAVDMIADSTDK